MNFRQVLLGLFVSIVLLINLGDTIADETTITPGCMAHNHCAIVNDASELTVTAFNPDYSERVRSYWKDNERYVESIAAPFVMVSHTKIEGLDGLSGKVKVDFTAPQAEGSESPNCAAPVVTANDMSSGSGELDVSDGDIVVITIICKPNVKVWGYVDFTMFVEGDDI